MEFEEEGRRKVDSAISFGSGTSSNRNSGQSHATRPSTSSSFSTGSHSRQLSREKHLPEKPLPLPKDDDVTVTQKPAGTTLERIARELRKIKSRNNIKEEQVRPRTASGPSIDSEAGTAIPGKDRTLKMKRSFRRMRSNTAISETPTGRPSSRNDDHAQGVPSFDADEMKRRRQEWEATHNSR
jgi:hypothetical protein